MYQPPQASVTVPPPAAHPEQLLQAVKEGLHPYAYRRLAAISATQVLLTKHMDKIAMLDAKIGGLFVDRVVLQQRCQTEHQRLTQWFMSEQELAELALGIHRPRTEVKDSRPNLQASPQAERTKAEESIIQVEISSGPSSSSDRTNHERSQRRYSKVRARSTKTPDSQSQDAAGVGASGQTWVRDMDRVLPSPTTPLPRVDAGAPRRNLPDVASSRVPEVDATQLYSGDTKIAPIECPSTRDWLWYALSPTQAHPVGEAGLARDNGVTTALQSVFHVAVSAATQEKRDAWHAGSHFSAISTFSAFKSG